MLIVISLFSNKKMAESRILIMDNEVEVMTELPNRMEDLNLAARENGVGNLVGKCKIE